LNNAPDPKGSRVVFRVKEISCSTCSLAIEKQVKKMEGVKDVRTSIMLDKVFIDYDPSRVSLDEIIKAVDRTGYGTRMRLAKR